MDTEFAEATNVEYLETVKPRTFEEARSNPKWKGAMKEEIQAQIKNETWNLVPLPARVKPISCK